MSFNICVYIHLFEYLYSDILTLVCISRRVLNENTNTNKLNYSYRCNDI